MNVDLGIWGRLTRGVIFLFALAGVLMVAAWYLPLIKQNQRMRTELLRQDAKLQEAKETNKQLKTATESLLTDPRAVERLARERLGYARPDEIVVRFEERTTTSPGTR